MRAALGTALCLLAAAGLAACGGDDSGDRGEAPDALGEPEGRLRLIAQPAAVGDLEAGPLGELVTAFERDTGCLVDTTVASSPEGVERLLRADRYDGLLARGDVSSGLIEQDLVSPLNTDLVPNYEDVFPALKGGAHDTRDGVPFGIAQGRVPNLMIAEPALLPELGEDPASTDLLFDPERASEYAGRITAPADPMYIAEAALYLREHREDLGIESPYELDREQFDAAIELLRAQSPYVGRYWSNPAQNVRAFVDDGAVAGTGRQRMVEQVVAAGTRIDFVLPDEGATGLVDSWMLAADARHPICMYMWMDFAISPEVNAVIAERTGIAPANERACDRTRDPAHCDVYRAADDELFDEVEYWSTPLRGCGDDRGDACVPYDEWRRAYAEIAGGNHSR